MSTKRWIGAAAALKDVYTLALSGTWTAGDTITLTIANVDFTITVGSTTLATIATTIKQAFQGESISDTLASVAPLVSDGAQSIGMFSELTATVSSTTVTFTAKTAGWPVTITAARVTASSGAITFTHATTATGPNYWSNVDNWEGNSVPVDNDDIVFDSGNVSVLHGLSTGIQPASVTCTKGYTGAIGLPNTNKLQSDALAYPEYRTTALTFTNNSVTTTVTIGQGDGNGSGRIKLAFGAGQAAITVFDTGRRLDSSEPAVNITGGTHASNVATVLNGDVGFGVRNGESVTLTTLRCGSDAQSTAMVLAGAACTLTTVTVAGGKSMLYASETTLTQYAGEVTQYAGVPATLRVYGGIYFSNSTGTIATEFTLGSGGTFDRNREVRPLTITPLATLYAGSKFRDRNATITYTGGVIAKGCSLSALEFDPGPNRTLAVS